MTLTITLTVSPGANSGTRRCAAIASIWRRSRSWMTVMEAMGLVLAVERSQPPRPEVGSHGRPRRRKSRQLLARNRRACRWGGACWANLGAAGTTPSAHRLPYHRPTSAPDLGARPWRAALSPRERAAGRRPIAEALRGLERHGRRDVAVACPVVTAGKPETALGSYGMTLWVATSSFPPADRGPAHQRRCAASSA